ncbi:unnamed protein product [Phytophthora fragariaefolia]|uniref:Unnamed protein product n=1 Tax=Phytophthora fragariaefolia TaxID=1490495 RepID=A0A9W7DC22_9STRA|nr:unnamed protein product [Phytophthora fragariaefolia]
MTLHPALPVHRLDAAIQAVVADGRSLVCDCTVDVDLKVNTAAGVVNVPHVNCVVMDSDEEELLLGKDILSDLGIHVDDMFAQLAHGADFVEDSDDFGVEDDSLEPRTVDDTQSTFEHLIAHASDNGMDVDHLENLREVLNQYPDIWQDSLNSGPPVRVEPLRIQLHEGATPTSVHAAQPPSSLSANRLQVGIRLTIDYRAVNRATVPIAGTMPNPAAIMDHVNGPVALAKLGMKNGFCRLSLAEESQETLSFMADEGMYTLTRVPQCAMDSAFHFQSQMQRVLSELTPDNTQKISLFEHQVGWCGRVISGQGIRHDPSRVSALTELPLPSTAAELQYIICASNWLRDSIVGYARVIAPLLEKFDAGKRRVGRRNRNAMNEAIAWTNAERPAFAAAIASIKHSGLMTVPTEDDDLCMLCDASMNGYSIVLTMVRAWDPARLVEDQNHSVVICKGGVFNRELSQPDFSCVSAFSISAEMGRSYDNLLSSAPSENAEANASLSLPLAQHDVEDEASGLAQTEQISVAGHMRKNFTAADDLVLLRAVNTVKPWEAAKGTTNGIMKSFERIAEIFNGVDGFVPDKQGPALRTRFDKLLRQYHDAEVVSRRASGTVEEYNERDVLLQDIDTCMNDWKELRENEKQLQQAKHDGIEPYGALMLRLAMQELGDELQGDSYSGDEGAMDEKIVKTEAATAKLVPSAQRTSAVAAFQK